MTEAKPVACLAKIGKENDMSSNSSIMMDNTDSKIMLYLSTLSGMIALYESMLSATPDEAFITVIGCLEASVPCLTDLIETAPQGALKAITFEQCLLMNDKLISVLTTVVDDYHDYREEGLPPALMSAVSDNLSDISLKTPEEDRVDDDERYSLHGNDVFSDDTTTERRTFQVPPAPIQARPQNHQLHHSLILSDITLCFGTVVRSGNSVGFIQSQGFHKDLIFYMNDLPQGMDLPLPKTSETVSFQVARRRYDPDQIVAVHVKVMDVRSLMYETMRLKMEGVAPVKKRQITLSAKFLDLKPATVINNTNNDFDIEFRPLEVKPRTIEETMTVARQILHLTKRDLRENNRGPRDPIEEDVWSKMEHLSLRAISLMYRIMESKRLINGMFTKQPMDGSALDEAGVFDLQIATEDGIVTDKAG